MTLLWNNYFVGRTLEKKKKNSSTAKIPNRSTIIMQKTHLLVYPQLALKINI